MLSDGFGRTVRYLRLSITGACNFSCAYCRTGSAAAAAEEDGCTPDELVRIAKAFIRLGVRGVRLTGGEPLLRRDVLEIVERLRALDGSLDLSLTTNGFGLKGMASRLKAAGLDRVNISMDSLEPSVFKQLAGVEGLARVKEGVSAALSAGLSPVKVNVVVVRGLNDAEVSRFAELTANLPLHVRFIELMPIGEAASLWPMGRVSLEEMMKLAGPLEPAGSGEKPGGLGPAVVYKRPGSMGTLGFIAAVSGRFCDTCNRARVTSRGLLLSCLGSEEGVDLSSLMRGGASDDDISAAIRKAIAAKPSGHAFAGCGRTRVGSHQRMCQIGG